MLPFPLPLLSRPQKLSTLKTKFEMQAKQNREAYNRLVVRAVSAVQCPLRCLDGRHLWQKGASVNSPMLLAVFWKRVSSTIH